MIRPSLLLATALFLLSAACSSTDPSSSGEAPPPAPPAHVINEQKTHADVHIDKPFMAEVVLQLRTLETLPDLDVRSLALQGDGVYAGTASGLMQWSPASQTFVVVPTKGTGAILDIAVFDTNNDTKLLLARDGGVEVIDPKSGVGELWPAAGPGVTSVVAAGMDVFIGNAQGLSRLSAAVETPVAAAQGAAIRDLVVTGSVVWMATGAGVRRYDAASDKLLADIAGSKLPDNDVRALADATDGYILTATAGGLARIDLGGTQSAQVFVGLDGLPNGDLTAVAEAGGEVLIGHAIGATTMSSGPKDHYHTLRWIPAEEVTAVALAPDGTRWIGTPAGISRISLEPRRATTISPGPSRPCPSGPSTFASGNTITATARTRSST